MKITKFGFVFENCEVLYVSAFDILLLQSSAAKTEYSGARGDIRKQMFIDDLFVAIRKDAVPLPESCLHDNSIKRITNDVTSIIFGYADNSTELHILQWPVSDDLYYSASQKVSTTEDGHIVFINSESNNFDSLLQDVDLVASF